MKIFAIYLQSISTLSNYDCPMLKKILLTTDFSVASEKAIQTAIDLLHNTDCEFTLIHCSDEKDTAKSRFYLNKFKEELEYRDTSPFHVYRAILLNIEPKQGIFEICQAEKFDIVVGGSTGIGNSETGGSTAQFMFQNISSYTFFVPYNAQVLQVNESVLVVEGLKIFNAQTLLRYKRFLQCLQISAKIVLLAKDTEQEKYVREELFWEVNKLFPNTKIEIRCDEYIANQACSFIQENPTNMIALLASEQLVTSLMKRITRLPLQQHFAAFLRLSANYVKEPKNEMVLSNSFA
jgi:nucleotide-binding universal stress UspA family protein